MRIFFIRHGDTTYNAQSIFRGTTDIPLSDTGIEQARLTGSEMGRVKLSLILSSPLSRALDTAALIEEKQHSHHLIDIEPAFMDLNYGDWQGHSKDCIAEAYPDLFYILLNTPQLVQFPGGESLSDATSRAVSRLKRLVEENNWKSVAIVTHRVIIKLLMLYVLDMPVSGFWRIHIDTCGISEVEYDYSNKRFILVRHNSVSHLSPLIGRITSHDF